MRRLVLRQNLPQESTVLYSLPITGITFVPYAIAAVGLVATGLGAMWAGRRRK